jgi:hypothetical protein
MQHLRQYVKLVGLIPGLWLLAGCANPSHLVFHQSTVLGVDVATQVDGSSIHATLGYDRQTVTLIPKSTIKNNQNVEEIEAMSIVARTRIKVQWLGTQEICERFATGKAARNIVQQAEAINALMTAKPSVTPVRSGCEDW